MTTTNPLRLAVTIQHTLERDADPVFQALAEVCCRWSPPWVTGSVTTLVNRGDGDYTWEGYRMCLEMCLRMDGTHLLVLQDDTSLAPGIWEWLPEIIGARRESVVSLFCGEWPHLTAVAMRMAAMQGRHWARHDLGEFIPAQALIWPRVLAERLLAETEAVPGPDDQHIAAWALGAGETVWQTVPSLVEHEGALTTTVPPKLTGPHRRAVCHVRDLGWPRSWDG